LALALTLIAMFLSAAVDLGLEYKAYQTLLNATAEATSYLSLNPFINCETHSCPDGTPQSGADREAIMRFRDEQSGVLHGSTSTMDLDGSGADDVTEHGWSWINARVKIQEADSSQVAIGSSNFGVGNTFNGTSNPDCQARKRFDADGNQCFIVVRSELIFHPFVLKSILGDSVSIGAISVKPIVEGD
jgi:hypothetical protein